MLQTTTACHWSMEETTRLEEPVCNHRFKGMKVPSFHSCQVWMHAAHVPGSHVVIRAVSAQARRKRNVSPWLVDASTFTMMALVLRSPWSCGPLVPGPVVLWSLVLWSVPCALVPFDPLCPLVLRPHGPLVHDQYTGAKRTPT